VSKAEVIAVYLASDFSGSGQQIPFSIVIFTIGSMSVKQTGK